jgi:imidazolonepropionase
VSEGLMFAPRLVTPVGAGPVRGDALGAPLSVSDAALAWRAGRIVYAGPAADVPGDVTPADPSSIHRVRGAIVPGFVDCHTHLPFVGWRADEFEARLSGGTYRDLQGQGGGIFRSSRLLRDASDDEVIAFCRPLLREMLTHGTTSLELKTGYGLSIEGELRQARLARRLAEEIPQTVTVTLLTCHAVPEGMTRQAWVDAVCGELVPAVAAEGLAAAVDVYVEDIAFSVDDLRKVADTARQNGLAVRCHADQLGASGATEVAVEEGARSADHLNNVSPTGISALGDASTGAVLLPTSTLFIGAERPPVGDLLEAGAAVTLASDFNPGTSPCLSMPEVIAAAAALYRLPPPAALTAATLNPAWVLGLQDDVGSLEPGKRADFAVLDADDPAMIAYRPGHNPIEETWIEGERVWTRSE